MADQDPTLVELSLRRDVEPDPPGGRGLTVKLEGLQPSDDEAGRLRIWHTFADREARGSPNLDIPRRLLPALLEVLAELNDVDRDRVRELLEREGGT